MTTFTEEQAAALDALEKAFGPTEISAARVKVAHAAMYARDSRHYLTYALENYGNYRLASDPEFAEAQRKALEEEARKRAEKLAERSAGVRESVVMGFMTGLMSKCAKASPESVVEFGTWDRGFDLTLDGNNFYITLNYDRETYTLATNIDANSVTVHEGKDDLTLISGNYSPREQVEGYRAVVDFLDGLKIDTLT